MSTGTALTDEQLALVERLVTRDHDESGPFLVEEEAEAVIAIVAEVRRLRLLLARRERFGRP